MDTFAPYLFFLVPTTMVICIIILVIAVFQDAKNFGKMHAIRNAFFTVMSYAALLTTFTSITFLSFITMRTFVFQDALTKLHYPGTPPELYLTKDTGAATYLSCVENTSICPLSENDKQQIAVWKESYTAWKKDNASNFEKGVSQQNRRDLVNTLSALAVAFPLLILFFILTLRVHKQAKPKSSSYYVYFYSAAFTGLACIVIAFGVLTNVTLKTWILPEEKNNAVRLYEQPYSPAANVEDLLDCAAVCGLSQEDAQLAKEWKGDYEKSIGKQGGLNPYHDDYAITIPLILFGGLMFAYHFITVRKEQDEEKKEKKNG